ncbi:MAG: hypothetical protein PHH40_00030 [Candidatus Moranbacteria bacterium]|nr:hypothetical protein [Candidatus Moranbacteria bacterium]MDD3965258.1 hypothetical protein [Candidatus Moranbacteria bacterium]
MSRKTKQFFVAMIYIFLFSLLFTVVYFAFIKAPETCFDGKKNQNEQGIDCSGVCSVACKEIVIGTALQIKEQSFMKSRENTYDILAKVFNPNGEIGAVSFSYTASLLDATGIVLASRTGTANTLPLENKYLLVFNLETRGIPVAVSLEMNDIVWERFSGYQEKPAVNIYRKEYNEVSSSAVFSEATGLVSNESSYDFQSLIVQVILRDVFGKPLAVNSTEMNTMLSRENRDFRLVWPTAFPGRVEDIEMVVDVDAYHSLNFIKQYLREGASQDFIPSKR